MSRERARIVSSAHFISENAVELSEVKYGLIVANNAFGVWGVRGTAAAIVDFPVAADLGVLDVLCLHSVNHHELEKNLVNVGLVESRRRIKEVLYVTSEMGRTLCLRFRDIREACLVVTFSALDKVDAEYLADLVRQLRVLSVLYGQAARSAANL